MFYLRLLLAVAGVWLPLACCAAQAPDFARDVRPLLSQHCFKCHGPDEKARQGGLRLDDRSSALTGGDSQVAAIVPGKSSQSEFVRRIESSDPDSIMPPPSTNRTLTAEQKAILRSWVDNQATYSEHWAFQAVPAEPVVVDRPNIASGSGQSTSAVSPIDVLVEQAAREQHLPLAPPAPPDVWLRRVYLDVVGLPPTYEEVQSYLHDERPDAKQRVVDRLLAAPAFGERWGRRWLDLARYADTNGYEKDRPRSIWPYRDWVIRAINDDLPLSDFAIQQLAGDLLPETDRAKRQANLIATGFHRNTMINEEGGIDPLEYRYYAMVDRVNTTSTAWLGLTVGCAQCHDHKYDPVSQHDYYAMMALLNNAEEPELEVFDADIAQRQQQADAEIATLRGRRLAQFPIDKQKVRYVPAAVANVKSQRGLAWSKAIDGRWQSAGKPAAKDTTSILVKSEASPQAGSSLISIRLRAIGQSITKDNQVVTSLGWSSSDNFVITRVRLEKSVAPNDSIVLSGAEASFEQSGYIAISTIDNDDKSGWGVGGHDEKPCEITWTLAEPIDWSAGQSLRLVLEQSLGSQHLLRGFELQVGLVDAPPVELARERREHLEQRYEQWRVSTLQISARWTLLKPTKIEANMARLEPQADGSFTAIGDISKRDEYLMQLPLEQGTTAIMIEGLTDPSMPRRGPGRTYYEGPIGDFFLSEVNLLDRTATPLPLRQAWVDFAMKGREADKALDADPLTGWSIDGAQGSSHRMVVALKEPITRSTEAMLRLLFERYYAAPLGRVRFWATASTSVAQACADLAPELQNQLAQTAQANATGQGTGQATEQSLSQALSQAGPLVDLFLSQCAELSGVNERIKQLEAARPKFVTTLVMQPRPDGFVRTTHRYHRGEFLSPREIVEPATPKFLDKLTASPPRDRLQLAQWLMDPQHPLTARVLANRYWSLLMGRGLVSTEEDFGLQGSFPTNQKLLDWLAQELVARQPQGSNTDGEALWSLKRWMRQVLLSKTYGRASQLSPALLEHDPGNVYLARVSRRRLDGEQLRDAVLASSGLLTRTMGGPSVYPPQPASVTTEGTYGKLAWPESHAADRYRRGLYTFSKRTAPFAMLATFDAPSGEACLARREAGDTPLQALTVLNDTLFLEAAKELGYRTVASTPSDSPDAIVRALFHKILLREPTADELAEMSNYLMDQVSAMASVPETVKAIGVGNSETTATGQSNATVAAATLLARVLLNTDEFINRD